jgi:hypothetical protein
MRRDARPGGRAEDEDGKATVGEALLETKLLIRRNEHLEALPLRHREQRPIR